MRTRSQGAVASQDWSDSNAVETETAGATEELAYSSLSRLSLVDSAPLIAASAAIKVVAIGYVDSNALALDHVDADAMPQAATCMPSCDSHKLSSSVASCSVGGPMASPAWSASPSTDPLQRVALESDGCLECKLCRQTVRFNGLLRHLNYHKRCNDKVEILASGRVHGQNHVHGKILKACDAAQLEAYEAAVISALASRKTKQKADSSVRAYAKKKAEAGKHSSRADTFVDMSIMLDLVRLVPRTTPNALIGTLLDVLWCRCLVGTLPRDLLDVSTGSAVLARMLEQVCQEAADALASIATVSHGHRSDRFVSLLRGIGLESLPLELELCLRPLLANAALKRAPEQINSWRRQQCAFVVRCIQLMYPRLGGAADEETDTLLASFAVVFKINAASLTSDFEALAQLASRSKATA